MRNVLKILFYMGSCSFIQAQDESNTLRLDYEHYQLNNGMQVVLQQDQTLKEVSIEFWIKAGSSNEAIDQFGLAHFFEHVTPYGLQNDLKNLKLLKENFYTGGNAQTKKDYTRYNYKVKPEGFELALKYVAERLKSKPQDIDREKIEEERDRVLNEIERNSGNAFWSSEGGMAIEKATYGETHPYGHSVYGTVENNKNFQLDDFRNWFSDHIYPKNILLIVVGNFEASKAKELIKNNLEDFQGNNTIHETQLSFPQLEKKFVQVNINSEDNYLVFVWPIPGWGSQEDPGIRLLSNIVDERLKNKKEQLPYIKDAGALKLLNFHKSAGQFGVYGSFSSLKDTANVEQVLIQTLQELIENGVTDLELIESKKREISKTEKKLGVIGFQNSRTELLAEGLLFKNDPGFYYSNLKRIAKFNTTDLNILAKTWLTNINSKVLLISKMGQ